MNRFSLVVLNSKPSLASLDDIDAYDMDMSLTDHSSSLGDSSSSSLSFNSSPRASKPRRKKQTKDILKRNLQTLDASSNSLLGHLPAELEEEEAREELPVIRVRSRRPPRSGDTRRRRRRGADSGRRKARPPKTHLELQIPNLNQFS